MKFFIAFVGLAIIGTTQAALDYQIVTEVALSTAKCAFEYDVPATILKEYVFNPDKSVLEPTEQIKCFTKCTVVDSGFVDENGVNVNNFVRNKMGLGMTKEQVLASIEGCGDIYQGVADCETSWKLFLCFNGIKPEKIV